jgi:hypothetical protein
LPALWLLFGRIAMGNTVSKQSPFRSVHAQLACFISEHDVWLSVASSSPIQRFLMLLFSIIAPHFSPSLGFVPRASSLDSEFWTLVVVCVNHLACGGWGLLVWYCFTGLIYNLLRVSTV